MGFYTKWNCIFTGNIYGQNKNYPEWFKSKWSNEITFSDSVFFISQKCRWKWYNSTLLEDFQKVLKELKLDNKIILALLHECGGITKVIIDKNKIAYYEPQIFTYDEVIECTHYECSNKCSEILEDNDHQ